MYDETALADETSVFSNLAEKVPPDAEIKFMWLRKKTASSFWFFLIRYIGFAGNVPVVIFTFISLSPRPRCLFDCNLLSPVPSPEIPPVDGSWATSNPSQHLPRLPYGNFNNKRVGTIPSSAWHPIQIDMF
ncbi:hypothetical protein DFH07DRAFT_774737 [Mycena maculata]|uniref:Uncharacterized protein n=1 Tax=Mycena maculata TaxID=230809 RepID=A0AAD7IXQ3_9AGAR|nr:hypothetical protein DFH07DRAFT_774737 [Mycena maculata]